MKNLKTACPICDGPISIPEGTQTSEILTCKECKNRVVVSKITKNSTILEKAPDIEEDWGQ